MTLGRQLLWLNSNLQLPTINAYTDYRKKYEILAKSLKHQKQLKNRDTKKDYSRIRHSSLSGPRLPLVTYYQMSYHHF